MPWTMRQRCGRGAAGATTRPDAVCQRETAHIMIRRDSYRGTSRRVEAGHDAAICRSNRSIGLVDAQAAERERGTREQALVDRDVERVKRRRFERVQQIA